MPHCKVPFAPILETGLRQYAMFNDLREYAWVLDPFRFESAEALIAALPEKIVAPAEAEHERLRKRREEIAAGPG